MQTNRSERAKAKKGIVLLPFQGDIFMFPRPTALP
jgi:hypothetical protein